MADMVNHPPHYNQYKHECQDFRDFITGPASDAFKYVWRFQNKLDPTEDLQKAIWYTERAGNFVPQPTITREHLDLLLRMLASIDFPYRNQRYALENLLKYGTGLDGSRLASLSHIRNLITEYEAIDG